MTPTLTKLETELLNSLNGKTPIILIHTQEEKRCLNSIKKIACILKKKCMTWNCISGLETFDQTTLDPSVAIINCANTDTHALFVFKWLNDFIHKPDTISALSEFYMKENSGLHKNIIIISPELNIPPALEKIIHLISAPPPDKGEIHEEFEKIKKLYPQTIDSNFEADIINALVGLSMPEIEAILHRLFKTESKDKDAFFSLLFQEKQAMMKKSGYLEFTPPTETIHSIGGLDNLKEWLLKRQKIFTKEALDANIPVPKGLLIMGVSGCGKSLAVKTIPSLWKIPLYRLDMNLIFSGIYGSPEATFHKALRSLESVAPAVLWIDEIENALGMDESGLKISSHIFSSFLTWMQEKPPFIFIAATANRIQALPAEVIRKGRFDQIFFVDLPTESERKQIFSIYLQRHGADLKNFDLKMLSIMTKGWNGAEIAQLISEAKIDAFYENRQFTQADITNNINKTVPLSTTMEAQIKAIRSWAVSRATPASAEGKILYY